jgi:hypothetical protein
MGFATKTDCVTISRNMVWLGFTLLHQDDNCNVCWNAVTYLTYNVANLQQLKLLIHFNVFFVSDTIFYFSVSDLFDFDLKSDPDAEDYMQFISINSFSSIFWILTEEVATLQQRLR